MEKNRKWEVIVEINGCDTSYDFYGTEKEADEYGDQIATDMDGIYRYCIDRSPRWSDSALRRFCIEHDFYTCGDNRMYGNMLRFVEENEPTDQNVRMVAIDIIAHSEKYDIYEDGDIDFIADRIWTEVVTC